MLPQFYAAVKRVFGGTGCPPLSRRPPRETGLAREPLFL